MGGMEKEDLRGEEMIFFGGFIYLVVGGRKEGRQILIINLIVGEIFKFDLLLMTL